MNSNSEIVNLIKNLALEKDLSISELARQVGMAKSAISRYFSFQRQIPLNRVSDFAKVLNVEPEYLLGMEKYNNIDTSKITTIYSQLNPPRQQFVIDTATNQLAEQKAEDEAAKKIEVIKEPIATYKSKRKLVPLKTYPFLLDAANAGSGCGDEYQYIEGLKAPVYPDADFIMKVSGDSMSPTFEDGDYIYVQKTIELYPGNIGIFLFDNVYYIKEYSDKCLISHNRDFDDIYPSDEDNIHIIGKVLRKVEFDV